MYGHYIVSLDPTVSRVFSHHKLQRIRRVRQLLTYSPLHYHASPRYSGSEFKQSGEVKR
jgi:hypothetical protein